MRYSRRQFGWFRLAISLAAVGQLPVAASADSWADATPAAPTELVRVDSAEALPLVTYDALGDALLRPGDPEPGLQFSLNPPDTGFVLGWWLNF